MIKDLLQYIIQKPLWAFVITILGFLLGLIPPFFLGVDAYWDNYKMILLSIGPTVYFGYYAFNKKKFTASFHSTDLIWLVFIVLTITSYRWSINSSLIWYPFFGWITLLLWMLIIRDLYEKEITNYERPFLHMIFLLIFLIIIVHVFVVYASGQLIKLERWNSHFGYNCNYTAAFLLSLFPVFLFYPSKSKLQLIWKLIGAFFILTVIYIANAKGSLITFFIVLILYIGLISYKTRFQKYLFPILVGCLIIIIYFINRLGGLVQIKEILLSSQGGAHRAYLLRTSFKMFIEDPILGKGLGNWYLHAYSEDLSFVNGYNHPTTVLRLGTHNLFELIIVELGLLGLTTFCISFLVIILGSIKKINTLSSLQKSAIITIVIYLSTGCFYRDVSIYEGNFSALQLLAFSSIGILTVSKRFKIINGFFLIGFLVLSITSLLWFSYYFYSDVKYKTAIKSLKRVSKAELLDTFLYNSYFEDNQQPIEHLEKTTDLMESIYHPIFKTTHRYYGNVRGLNRPLSLHLAQLYQRQGKYELAETAYQNIFEWSPNDELALRSYARFLIRYKHNYKKAKQYAKKAYNIQKNNFYSNILLGEIALKQKDYETAKNHLEFVENHELDYGFKDLAYILLTELELETGNIEKAKGYLELCKNTRYKNQIKNLQSRLNQLTNSPVQQTN